MGAGQQRVPGADRTRRGGRGGEERGAEWSGRALWPQFAPKGWEQKRQWAGTAELGARPVAGPARPTRDLRVSPWICRHVSALVCRCLLCVCVPVPLYVIVSLIFPQVSPLDQCTSCSSCHPSLPYISVPRVPSCLTRVTHLLHVPVSRVPPLVSLHVPLCACVSHIPPTCDASKSPRAPMCTCPPVSYVHPRSHLPPCPCVPLVPVPSCSPPSPGPARPPTPPPVPSPPRGAPLRPPARPVNAD